MKQEQELQEKVVGKSPHGERGLQATDDETRARVAREGGRGSHGGRRRTD